MPTRLRLRVLGQGDIARISNGPNQLCRCQYATVTATTPAAPIEHMTTPVAPIQLHPTSQPPSYRSPEARRSQLLREYVSLLNTTPLFIVFQHNNLKANEWVGIRRELTAALKKLDEAEIASGRPENAISSAIKLEIIRTNMFEPALRVSEYYQPPPPPNAPEANDPTLQTSSPRANASPSSADKAYTHALSRQAYEAASRAKGNHPLTPLLAGPIALLTFPTVSPQYLKAALQILSPQGPKFPAPTRRANPGYWDNAVQDGLKKLMLLGARVEGKVIDNAGTKWVGTIDGGIDGLRAQLVSMLQSFGGGVTGALESASRNLYFTMEGRKNMLEEQEKPAEGAKDNAS